MEGLEIMKFERSIGKVMLILIFICIFSVITNIFVAADNLNKKEQSVPIKPQSEISNKEFDQKSGDIVIDIAKDQLVMDQMPKDEFGWQLILGKMYRNSLLIGCIMAFLVVLWFVFQWSFASSVEEKLQLKKKMWLYFIFALLAFVGTQVIIWTAASVTYSK